MDLPFRLMVSSPLSPLHPNPTLFLRKGNVTKGVREACGAGHQRQPGEVILESS